MVNVSNILSILLITILVIIVFLYFSTKINYDIYIHINSLTKNQNKIITKNQELQPKKPKEE